MRTRTFSSLAAVLALGLAACGGGNGDTTSTVATPPPPPASTPTPPPPPPPPTPKPAVATVNIVVRGGKVDGGLKRTTVRKGEKVVLVVRSDVADEVHLHGYDKSVDVTPSKPARLAFVASLPGRFEVELEDRGLQVADLEVRP